jgi:large subunit ribosomal protein L32
MPTPKRKTSKSRRDMRSANKHLIPQAFAICHNNGCTEPTLPHRACRGCGFYKGTKILSIKAKKVAAADTTTPEVSE